MSKARLVITAIEVEGRSAVEVVAAYGVSRSWLYELLARYRAEGDAAVEPRSRRPHSSPGATPAQTVELVLRIRKQQSATRAWTPAPRRSAGTWPTITGPRCRGPRSTGS
jgi:transposase